MQEHIRYFQLGETYFCFYMCIVLEPYLGKLFPKSFQICDIHFCILRLFAVQASDSCAWEVAWKHPDCHHLSLLEISVLKIMSTRWPSVITSVAEFFCFAKHWALHDFLHKVLKCPFFCECENRMSQYRVLIHSSFDRKKSNESLRETHRLWMAALCGRIIYSLPAQWTGSVPILRWWALQLYCNITQSLRRTIFKILV